MTGNEYLPQLSLLLNRQQFDLESWVGLNLWNLSWCSFHFSDTNCSIKGRDSAVGILHILFYLILWESYRQVDKICKHSFHDPMDPFKYFGLFSDTYCTSLFLHLFVLCHLSIFLVYRYLFHNLDSSKACCDSFLLESILKNLHFGYVDSQTSKVFILKFNL